MGDAVLYSPLHAMRVVPCTLEAGEILSTYLSLSLKCFHYPTHPQTQILFACTKLLAMLERRPFKLGQLRSGSDLSDLKSAAAKMGFKMVGTQGDTTATAEETFHMIVGGPLQSVRHSTCAACEEPSAALLQCTGCR
jgi:hypothetical protein